MTCPHCMNWFEEVRDAHRRIKELEEGSCRFNCRSMKEAFMAGWHLSLKDDDIDFICDWQEDRLSERAYKQWLKEQNDG